MLKDFRKAIAKHKTPTASGPWDGPQHEGRLKTNQEPAYFFRAFAFQDPEKDARTKAAYRFIHHEVGEDGTPGAANLRACVAGIGVLNGARGGTTIPEAERQGVYDHLAAHLRDAGRVPPPLRSGVEFERRFLGAEQGGELRAAGTEADPIIEGTIAYNSISQVIAGSFREMVMPGAFTKTIKESDIRSLWNHEPNFVLGRSKAGTLTFEDSPKGLIYRANPPKTTWASDLLVSMRRGDVTSSSFGFRKVVDEWTVDEAGFPLRKLHEVRLFDTSPVTFPAYEASDSAVRGLSAFAGLDSEALAGAIRKKMMGLDLDEAERAIIRESIDFLRYCVPDEEPAERGHSPEPSGDGHSLAILRRKLDLLEVES